jgi:GNAT superfamily N-acetyltransferase
MMTQNLAKGHALRRLMTLTETQIESLSEILIDCVAGGASVSFLHPLSHDRARGYWHEVRTRIESGEVALLIADDSSGIVGTVQIALRQPENQSHRAHISKMLVHSRSQRRGVGTALMLAAEDLAREQGKTLLDLDTAVGASEEFYYKLGWRVVGTVPGYALSGFGEPCDYRFFYRKLDSSRIEKFHR